MYLKSGVFVMLNVVKHLLRPVSRRICIVYKILHYLQDDNFLYYKAGRHPERVEGFSAEAFARVSFDRLRMTHAVDVIPPSGSSGFYHSR